ncbi:MAG: VOC family protein, partial [Mucilaginibacter sp.]
MKPESAATIFHVRDVESSIKYYQEILGFDIDFRYNDLAGMVYGNVLIYLSGPGQEAKKMNGEGSIYVFCNEVDQYYRNIMVKGAIVSVDLEDRVYGMRDFAVLDPDGNYIAFG